MAQWIPKTAWKVSNLNKRYGEQYVVQGAIGGGEVSSLGSSVVAFAAAAIHQKKAREKFFKTLKLSRERTLENPFPGSCLIDVREQREQLQFPLTLCSTFSSSAAGTTASPQPFFSQRASSSFSSLIISLHPHDILSGAAAPLLPRNKRKAELFVVASSMGGGTTMNPPQRAMNALAALHRWGYRNCYVLDYETAASLLDVLKDFTDKKC